MLLDADDMTCDSWRVYDPVGPSHSPDMVPRLPPNSTAETNTTTTSSNAPDSSINKLEPFCQGLNFLRCWLLVGWWLAACVGWGRGEAALPLSPCRSSQDHGSSSTTASTGVARVFITPVQARERERQQSDRQELFTMKIHHAVLIPSHLRGPAFLHWTFV